MACMPLTDDEGRTIGVVCVRSPRHRLKCVSCRKRAAQYRCDHRLRDDELRFQHQDTCDAPLCQKCRHPGLDGADFCPIHQNDSVQPRLL